MSQTPEKYFVGDWLVEPALQRVSKKRKVVKLEPQVMTVLQQLARSQGEVVNKKTLMNTVWSGVVVTENVLTRAVSSLRKALDDDPNSPKYIETISKTGYRLIAKIKPQKPANNKSTFTIKLAKRPTIWIAGIGLFVALGAFTVIKILMGDSPGKAYQPIPIANYANAEYWPAISPDGKFVAYGWKGEANDNWDIYAKAIGTETILRITDNPATDLRAKWSADGNYVYYLRYENGGSTIYKKSVFGESEIRILASPKYCSGDFDISPDEKWISYNGREGEDKSAPLQLKLISLETGEVKTITSPDKVFNGDIHPTFSPDGKQLAFIRERNSASMQLWLYELNSGNVEKVTNEHISINGFDWTDDGTSLIYGGDKTGLYKLWKVNLLTRASTMLLAGDYQMVMPRVAASGRTVYAKMKDNVNIWSYHLEHKIAKPWRATNELNLNPVFSLDGKKVCFTMLKDKRFQIWVANADGSGAIPITNFVGQYLSSPRWSHDNTSIVFQGFLNGQADIYKVNARGGVAENLTNSTSDDHNPCFSSNEKIYYSSSQNGEWGIWRMEADGSGKVQVVDNNAYAQQLSRDEKVVYYTKKEQFGLWAFDLERGEERLVIEAFHPMHWGAFAIDEKGIYYLSSKSKGFEYLDLTSGQSTFVYRPQARIPRLGITLHLAPDGKQFLFSQIDHHDSDIMLLEELP